MMAQAIIRAEVDGEARLVRCDAALTGLQLRAGGLAQGPVAIPQLARLVALAMRDGAPLSKPIIAGDEGCDISMWVRVTPKSDGAYIEIVDWVETEPAHPRHESDSVVDHQWRLQQPLFAPNWNWECNPQLRLSALSPGNGSAGGDLHRWIGHSLTEFFKLQCDTDGQFPMLLALACQQAFSGQMAFAVPDPDGLIELSARPFYDSGGAFSGYRGTATLPSFLPGAGLYSDAGGGELVLNAIAPTQLGDVEQTDDGNGSCGARTGDFSRRIDSALRCPLGRIIANAETISDKLEGPIRQDYADYATDIAVAGRHIMGLIDDLADLQVIERPGFQPAREAVDLADIGRRTAGLLMMKARDRGMSINAPALGESVIATGEFRRTLQILLNLVGNAIRYAPEGSPIWIRTETDAGYGRITVADQGYGIAGEEQAKIFDKFERLGRDDRGGSGLGLYIAQRLARAMGGEILLDSAPGEGARFSLILPVEETLEKSPDIAVGA